jgi:hypothetical protein
MATLRAFTENDVPAVAALFARVYPEQSRTPRAAYESYLKQMLFDNPWRDLQLPSWVAENNGRITGFLGVVPRPMQFRNRNLRAAVSCQFMVDPDQRHSLTALQLAKAFLSGPQDLSLVDGANDLSRRVWVGLGGKAPLLYSLHWTRPLRPARLLISLLEERSGLPHVLSHAIRPLAGIVDALISRLRPNRFLREEAESADEVLDLTAMLAHLPSVMQGRALKPLYDARTLAWLLEQAARKTRHGKLRARAVLDDDRRLVGWYLYYLRVGGASEVVQVAATEGWFDRVLQRLLADAWRQGAAAVCGRVDPQFAQNLSDRHCWSRWGGAWTLIHSRHTDIQAAIDQGDAFLSRLEGEWWLRFLGG